MQLYDPVDQKLFKSSEATPKYTKSIIDSSPPWRDPLRGLIGYRQYR